MMVLILTGLGAIQLINAKQIETFIESNSGSLLEESIKSLYPENVAISTFKTHYKGAEELESILCIKNRFTSEEMENINKYIRNKYDTIYSNTIYSTFFDEDEFKVYQDSSGLNIKIAYREKFSMSRFRHTYSTHKLISLEKYSMKEEENNK